VNEFTGYTFINAGAEGAVKRKLLPLAGRADAFINLSFLDLPSANSAKWRRILFKTCPAIKTEKVTHVVIFQWPMADQASFWEDNI
jgi:hypothetical protein